MMKRGLISVITAVMVVTMLFAAQTILPAGAAPAGTMSGYFEGEGTEDNPYLVATAKDLYNIWFDTDAHYRQISDIVFKEEDFAEGGAFFHGGRGWYPIDSFSGSFDGDSYIISGLVIKTNLSGSGLFGSVWQQAVITNVTLLDVEIEGENIVGGLAGSNFGKISNSEVRGKVAGSYLVGGLVGQNGGSIKNSVASVEVRGETVYNGGLVGLNSGSIEDSHAWAEVHGGSYTGGLVGRNWGSIINSEASGKVSGNLQVGGLVGQNQGSITQAAAYGEVHGENGAGGLVGQNTGSITESYAHGQVSGHEVIGGLAGFNNGSIADSYAIGKVDGEELVGGLVGSGELPSIRRLSIDNPPKIINSFWNAETSGQEESAGGVGKTTQELTSYFPYGDAGWDFIGETANGTEDIWGMNPNDNDGYPFLSWQEFTRQVPVVMTDITEGVSDVAVTTAVSSGVIVNIGQPEAKEHGHVWSTSPKPTVADGKTELGPVVEGESFTSELTDLTPNTIHYVRAYVINEDYVAYGEEIEFKTEPQLLTINDFSVEEKVYDGDVAAPVKKVEFEGILAGHANFSVGTVGAEFSHRRAGEDNSVSLSSVQLIGNDAYKYLLSLNGAPEVTALITPKALELLGLSIQDKVYDGTVEAKTTAFGRLSGIVGADDVTLTTDKAKASFADRHVGVDKQVAVRGLALTGQDAHNYSIGTARAPASITPRELTVAADGQRKSFGEADPGFTYKITDGELVTGDELFGTFTRIEGEEAGVYNIQLGTLANSNYQINFLPADLVIVNAIFNTSHSSTGIIISGLEKAVRLPELDQEDVTQVVVELVADKLQADHDTLARAAAELGTKDSIVLEAFSLNLIKTVDNVDGSSTKLIVPNEDIIGSIKIQLPLPEEFEGKNPGIVYIDDDGKVTVLASSLVTLDGNNYLEFEIDHFSVFAMVGDAEAADLTWLWIVLGAVLGGGLILVGRKIIQ